MPGITSTGAGSVNVFPKELKYPPTFVEALAFVRGLAQNSHLAPETELLLAKIEGEIERSLPAQQSQREALRAIAFILLGTEYLMSDNTVNPPHKSITLSHISAMWASLDPFWTRRAQAAYVKTKGAAV